MNYYYNTWLTKLWQLLIRVASSDHEKKSTILISDCHRFSSWTLQPNCCQEFRVFKNRTWNPKFCEHLRVCHEPGLTGWPTYTSADIIRVILRHRLYSVGFDPLDGSSIIDANFAVGSIFGVWPGDKLLGRTGREQVRLRPCLL